MQPMTALVPENDARIFIFTSNTTDIGKVGEAAARFVVFGRKDDYYGFVSGRIVVCNDAALREALWSPVIAAWFPDGREDPSVHLIEFIPRHADIWASTNNPLRFGIEIARANALGELPDLGERRSLRFEDRPGTPPGSTR